MFPTINQYIESLSNPNDLLCNCKELKLALNFNNEPIFSSGNFGVVFKIELDGQYKAIKCFTKEQFGRKAAYQNISENFNDNSNYTIDFKFLDNEISVFYEDGTLLSFPILLMDWVDGDTLDLAIHKAVLTNDTKYLRSLNRKFNNFAQWLLKQPFAHGDLKPENLIINQNNELVMIDYDGLYLPNMNGENQREIGTFNYQHPLRPKMQLNKSIDDFSIAIISTTLDILTHYPTFYFQYGGGSASIFNPEKIIKYQDPCYSHLRQSEIGQKTIFKSLKSKTPQINNLIQFLEQDIDEAIDFEDNTNLHDDIKTRKIVCINDAYGFADKMNNIVIETKYDCVNDFCEGYATVCSKRHWGAIDECGKIVVPIIYDQIRNHSQGLFAVRLNNKWGYVSTLGQNIIAIKFDNCWSFRCNRALVKKRNKYSFINLQGEIIATGFDYAQSFTENFACVVKDDKYGFIDIAGDWFIKPIFDHASSVINNTVEVTIDHKKYKLSLNQKNDSNKKLMDLLSELK